MHLVGLIYNKPIADMDFSQIEIFVAQIIRELTGKYYVQVKELGTHSG